MYLSLFQQPQANDDTETHHHLHKVENQLSNESGIGLAMDEVRHFPQ